MPRTIEDSDTEDDHVHVSKGGPAAPAEVQPRNESVGSSPEVEQGCGQNDDEPGTSNRTRVITQDGSDSDSDDESGTSKWTRVIPQDGSDSDSDDGETHQPGKQKPAEPAETAETKKRKAAEPAETAETKKRKAAEMTTELTAFTESERNSFKIECPSFFGNPTQPSQKMCVEMEDRFNKVFPKLHVNITADKIPDSAVITRDQAWVLAHALLVVMWVDHPVKIKTHAVPNMFKKNKKNGTVESFRSLIRYIKGLAAVLSASVPSSKSADNKKAKHTNRGSGTQKAKPAAVEPAQQTNPSVGPKPAAAEPVQQTETGVAPKPAVAEPAQQTETGAGPKLVEPGLDEVVRMRHAKAAEARLGVSQPEELVWGNVMTTENQHAFHETKRQVKELSSEVVELKGQYKAQAEALAKSKRENASLQKKIGSANSVSNQVVGKPANVQPGKDDHVSAKVWETMHSTDPEEQEKRQFFQMFFDTSNPKLFPPEGVCECDECRSQGLVGSSSGAGQKSLDRTPARY
jgi:hypothetical protein